jgi:undecaprenol kinase/diacylglycerol kinase (ATP)
MKKQKFSTKKRLKSFIYAFNGLKTLLKEEHNSRIHLIAAICAIVLSIVLQISTYEWLMIIFAIGFVFAMELVNTAIENIADFLTTDIDERVKKIKDLVAAATLVSAIVALVVGVVVFLPRIVGVFTSHYS